MAEEAAPWSFVNWSGFELQRSLKLGGAGPGGVGFDEPYDWVKGMWVVPYTTGELPSSTQAQCAIWVGLDGDGTLDLVQAGTNAISTRFEGSGLIDFIDISTYFAWTEFLPQQPQMQQVTSVPVMPGDQMLVEVWVGNPGSGPTLSGSFGCFLLMNLTAGVGTSFTTPVGTTTVGGSEAVWIVERPLLYFPASGIFGKSTRYAYLGNYGSVVISDAFARKANSPSGSGFVSYFGARNRQITMIDSFLNTLSTVTPIDLTSMRFDWKAFG